MNNLVECPVCSKQVNKFMINEHVNACLNNNVDQSSVDDNVKVADSKKRKSDTPPKSSGWGFLTSENRNVKRTKLQESGPNFARNKSEVEPQDSKVVIDLSAQDCSRPEGSARSQPPVDLSTPLAEVMRPRTLEEYVGQEKAVGDKSLLRSLLQSDTIPSLLLWGPPGCGKTTLARVISHRCKGKAKFVQLSATSSGVNDVKEVIRNAKNDMRMFKKRTILFLDEIHRFNKTQQDTLLPHVEDGTITLIGATTENPSFQVNSALLSRCRVVSLEKLDSAQLLVILGRAVRRLGVHVIHEAENVAGETDGTDARQLGQEADMGDSGRVCIEHSALQFLSEICDGDARQALNSLQLTVQAQTADGGTKQGRPPTETKGQSLSTQKGRPPTGEKGQSLSTNQGMSLRDSCAKGDNSSSDRKIVITSEHVKKGLEKSHIAYDKTGEEHYNCASALIKSMRGSSDSAALYWLARMLEGGETPLFVARRLVIFASEDVGLADPQSLQLAVATYQACHFIGMPECQINLAHCVVHLARAPKSVESFAAYNKAKACVHSQGPLPPVPLHLRNAPTKLMKDMGYGKGYKYNPASKTPVDQEYFPDSLKGTNFFT